MAVSDQPGAHADKAPHRPLTEFYSAPAERASYIARLFNQSAQHYDWISGILAFGTDRYYRRIALQKAGLRPGLKLLDVASGTGLVARAALELGLPATDVIGLDPSIGMLKQNQKNAGVPLVQACGEFLPFRSLTFDFVSMGYALRHVESLPVFFAELKRVLKPGGAVLLLEISRPESAVAFQFLKLYFSVLPIIARFRTNSRDLRELLKYYWATIAECVPPAEITENLRGAGFSAVERKRFGPILNDYLARKPA